MSDNIAGGGGAVKPDADSTSVNGAGVDIDSLLSKVAEMLPDKLAPMVTGAVKNHIDRALASKFDGIDFDALKALGKSTDAKDKDDKVSPLEQRLQEMQARVESVERERQAYKTRALSGEIFKHLDAANVIPDAREFIARDLSAIAKEEAETGRVLIPVKDSYGNEVNTPLADFIGDYLKGKPSLVRSESRSGSGAGAGVRQFSGASMPKTRDEVMNDYVKDPITGKIKQVRNGKRYDAFIAEHGRAAFLALPLK